MRLESIFEKPQQTYIEPSSSVNFISQIHSWQRRILSTDTAQKGCDTEQLQHGAERESVEVANITSSSRLEIYFSKCLAAVDPQSRKRTAVQGWKSPNNASRALPSRHGCAFNIPSSRPSSHLHRPIAQCLVTPQEGQLPVKDGTSAGRAQWVRGVTRRVQRTQRRSDTVRHGRGSLGDEQLGKRPLACGEGRAIRPPAAQQLEMRMLRGGRCGPHDALS